METAWDSELAAFLSDLSAVQSESLELLTRKREMLVQADAVGLASLGGEEERLIEKLQGCLMRREDLLHRAAEEGRPAGSIRQLAESLPQAERKRLAAEAAQAASRTRILQHHSLTNWVIIQKTLIHLSQMVEIIATGGQLKPTYGKDESTCSTGGLVNQVG